MILKNGRSLNSDITMSCYKKNDYSKTLSKLNSKRKLLLFMPQRKKNSIML